MEYEINRRLEKYELTYVVLFVQLCLCRRGFVTNYDGSTCSPECNPLISGYPACGASGLCQEGFQPTLYLDNVDAVLNQVKVTLNVNVFLRISLKELLHLQKLALKISVPRKLNSTFRA